MLFKKIWYIVWFDILFMWLIFNLEAEIVAEKNNSNLDQLHSF